MGAELFVRRTIERLLLIEMIRRWNRVGGSKIATWEDFLLAVDQTPGKSSAYEAAMEEAVASGVATFEEEIRWQLEPVIRSSCLTGVLEEARAWAARAIEGGPAAHEVSVTFADAEQWADWMVSNVEHPATLVDPDGRCLFDRQATENLFKLALMAEKGSAMRAGWVPFSDVTHSASGSPKTRDYLDA